MADRDVATAQIAAYKATADAQKLNVEFCTVRAPIAGRVSKSNITLGNLVADRSDAADNHRLARPDVGLLRRR